MPIFTLGKHWLKNQFIREKGYVSHRVTVENRNTSNKDMIKLIALLFLWNVSSYSASIEITWNANVESNLAGYKIYWGDTSGALQNSTSVGNVTRFVLNNVNESRPYYFVVTALNTAGLESRPSNEAVVFARKLPVVIQNFVMINGRASFIAESRGNMNYWTGGFSVEVSEDLLLWTEATRFEFFPIFFVDSAGAGRPQRFYRVVSR